MDSMAEVLDRLLEQGVTGSRVALQLHGEPLPGFVEALRDAGAQVSLAFPIEMVMRHGTPPILKMQELGMEPSLSSDVETTMAADPFTLMRSAMIMPWNSTIRPLTSGTPGAGS